MKIKIDTHTHTVASGHAYSTVIEIAEEAARKGIKGFAIADHGPAMPGAPYIYHFNNLRVIPKEIKGVRVIRGAEANILDTKGKLDIPVENLKNLELVLASLHEICIPPTTRTDHTDALLSVIHNPYIDVLAHTGNPNYPIDINTVVREARDAGKLIEINNGSFIVREGSAENCREIALKCKEYGVRVVCGSDAHISFDVGRFDYVLRLFKEIGFPEELVLCTSLRKMENYFQEKAARISRL